MKYKDITNMINTDNNPAEILDPIDAVIDSTTLPAKVILYNDEWHTFDEVIIQLIKATNCTPQRAESLAFEVDSKGKAVVYDGDMPECLKVSAILEEIELNTEVEV
jgi:ATP-dependent Clp protease adaptor protein ClpS